VRLFCDKIIRNSKGGLGMEKVLINTDKYNGCYVAMKSFDDHTIVGVGDDPESALKDAKLKGYKEPVLLYIPEKELVHIYHVIK
jgi:hypothetical protein